MPSKRAQTPSPLGASEGGHLTVKVKGLADKCAVKCAHLFLGPGVDEDREDDGGGSDAAPQRVCSLPRSMLTLPGSPEERCEEFLGAVCRGLSAGLDAGLVGGLYYTLYICCSVPEEGGPALFVQVYHPERRGLTYQPPPGTVVWSLSGRVDGEGGVEEFNGVVDAGRAARGVSPI